MTPTTATCKCGRRCPLIVVAPAVPGGKTVVGYMCPVCDRAGSK